VILDGDPIYACLTLAIACEGKAIRTIEGLAQGGRLHPVQQAFVEQDGYQCGFCTPGQIMAAVALLERTPHPSEEQVLTGMSGNICRCAAYPNIVEAVLDAAERRSGDGEA
jgi:aerobic-type carbon monoxide dehydrogenase small subunit (CoxS/CutS family)